MGKFLRVEKMPNHVHVDKETGEKTVTEMVKVIRENQFGTEDFNIVEKESFYNPESKLFNPKLNSELEF